MSAWLRSYGGSGGKTRLLAPVRSPRSCPSAYLRLCVVNVLGIRNDALSTCALLPVDFNAPPDPKPRRTLALT